MKIFIFNFVSQEKKLIGYNFTRRKKKLTLLNNIILSFLYFSCFFNIYSAIYSESMNLYKKKEKLYFFSEI